MEYQKYVIAMRHHLLGAKMFNAHKAFEMVLQHHTGFRKDQKTPNHMHPLSVARFGITLLDSLIYKEESVTCFLLHDISEDYGISYAEIAKEFGVLVADNVSGLTKKFRGIRISDEEYYENMSTLPIASIGKGIDRICNQNDMQGVFSREKQLSYVMETQDFVLPMIKQASRRFPQQYVAYENVKLHLKSQMALIRAERQNG